MSNGFEALAPLADKLKTQARRQEAEREAKQKASEHIARETNVFLDVMNQTGVKAMAGVRIKPRIEEKDIDFAAAMKRPASSPWATRRELSTEKFAVRFPFKRSPTINECSKRA